jgi:hypothetical protein
MPRRARYRPAAARRCGGGGAESPSAAPAAAQPNLPPFNFEIRTLSNRADLISDGNALVEVSVPKTVPMKKVTLTLNGADVGASFVVDESARTFRGVVTGLVPGANTLVADSNGNGNGRPWASLTITNHVRGGPILLGSQTQPWVCATPTPVAESGNTPASNASGLTTFAVDAKCNIATEYKLFYRTTTAGCSTALPDPSPPAAQPTNNCFKSYTPARRRLTWRPRRPTPVPRCLTSCASSAARSTAASTTSRCCFDPTRAAPWTALAPQSQWNGKVLYSFGASTGPAAPAVPHRAETGPTTPRSRAASWSSTTA